MRIRRPYRIVVISLFVLFSLVGNVSAQTEKESRWSFGIAPYLWLSQLDGRMATLPPLPAADVSLKAGDILENLDAAFMALVELRKGRWGAFGDIIYSSLSSEADPPLGLLYSNPELECTNLILTLAGTYRPISGPNGFLDIVVGGRYWSVDTHFEL